jgi:adenylate kinase family enzyme/nucleoside-diphosphate-sugar epimerase
VAISVRQKKKMTDTGALPTLARSVKRAFVGYLDCHVGAAVAERLLDAEYDVSGMTLGASLPATLAADGRIRNVVRRTDAEGLRRGLLEADLIVYHTPGAADDTLRALRVLSSSTYESAAEKRFVLLSSTQSWFATPPLSAQGGAASPAAFPADATDEDIVGALEALTEDQYNRRVPHVRHQAWRDVEKLCASLHTDKKLRTSVVFSGLVYGAGEDMLAPYFTQSWSLAPAGLPLFGTGWQAIPTVHVRDLATFVSVLATTEEQTPRYTFAVDGGAATWGSIVRALNTELGNGRVFHVPAYDYGLYDNIEQFVVNLRIEAGTMNELMPDDAQWVSRGGLVANMPQIVREFRAARGLTPLRVLLLGPPGAGKSYAARHLAQHYKLPRFAIADIIAEYRHQEVELADAVAQRRAEKLILRKAERLEVKRQALLEERRAAAGARDGADVDDIDSDEYDADADDEVMDVALTADEVKEIAEAVEEEMAVDDAVAALKQRIEEVKVVSGMLWKPILELEAEAPNPKDRLKGSKGGKAGAAAAKKRKDGDAPHPDAEANAGRLSDRALAYMVRWKLGATPECRNQGYILDGFPKTVRQARLVFEAMEHDAPDADAPDMALPDEVGPCNEALLPDFALHFRASDPFLLERLLLTQAEAAHNTPEDFMRRLEAYKTHFECATGVLSYFESARSVGGRGVTLRQVAADNAPHVPVSGEKRSVHAPVQLPPLVCGIVDILGRPHNLGPSPADELREAERARELAEEQRREADAAAQHQAQMEGQEVSRARGQQRDVDARAEQARDEERRMLEERKAPLRAYLMQNVVPVLTKGLLEVCSKRPDDPVEFLAEWLFRHNPEDHPEMYN